MLRKVLCGNDFDKSTEKLPLFMKMVQNGDKRLRVCLLYTSVSSPATFCHEIDHLDGHMYVEKVEGELTDVEEVEE